MFDFHPFFLWCSLLFQDRVQGSMVHLFSLHCFRLLQSVDSFSVFPDLEAVKSTVWLFGGLALTVGSSGVYQIGGCSLLGRVAQVPCALPQCLISGVT